MTPATALRRFEQLLIGLRTIATNEHAYERYRDAWLPVAKEGAERAGTPRSAEAFEALVHQGFTAGYDAAMIAVLVVLNEVQTEVLRGPSPAAPTHTLTSGDCTEVHPWISHHQWMNPG